MDAKGLTIWESPVVCDLRVPINKVTAIMFKNSYFLFDQ